MQQCYRITLKQVLTHYLIFVSNHLLPPSAQKKLLLTSLTFILHMLAFTSCIAQNEVKSTVYVPATNHFTAFTDSHETQVAANSNNSGVNASVAYRNNRNFIIGRVQYNDTKVAYKSAYTSTFPNLQSPINGPQIPLVGGELERLYYEVGMGFMLSDTNIKSEMAVGFGFQEGVGNRTYFQYNYGSEGSLINAGFSVRLTYDPILIQYGKPYYVSPTIHGKIKWSNFKAVYQFGYLLYDFGELEMVPQISMGLELVI